MPLVEVDADEFAQLNADYKALVDKLDETLKGLKDPATVWANMLRGEIARPTALEHYERMARDIERLEDTERRRNDWLHKAKQEWGADDRVSFDVVWKEALELKSRLISCENEVSVRTDERDGAISLLRQAEERNKELESRLDTATKALHAIRDGIPGVRLHATDALIALGALDVRCGNANCNVLLSAGEPHVEGCLGTVVEELVEIEPPKTEWVGEL